MLFHNHQDEARCKAFSLTLSSVTRTWYKKLKPRSIDSFEDLGSKFVSRFKTGQVNVRSTEFLFYIKQ